MADIMVYFNNGIRARFPEDKLTFTHLGSMSNEEYKPDTTDGRAVVNWRNVCFVRAFEEKEDDE